MFTFLVLAYFLLAFYETHLFHNVLIIKDKLCCISKYPNVILIFNYIIDDYFLGGDSFAAREDHGEDHGEDKGQEGHQQVEHQGQEGHQSNEAGQDQGMDHDHGHHEDHHVEDQGHQEDHGRQEEQGQDNHGQDYQDGSHDDQQQSQEHQHFDENQVSQVTYLFNYVLMEIKKYYYIICIKSRRSLPSSCTRCYAAISL